MCGVMGKVVTQVDIMKFENAQKAIFPEGTIVTPSAKDWASEHNLQIIIGVKDKDEQGIDLQEDVNTQKSQLLKNVIISVLKNTQKISSEIEKDEITEIVIRSLNKLGCKVV